MSEIHTKSTSLATAQADDVVVRASDAVRLVFRPTIVENRSNPEAAVRGLFLYQRKLKASDWVDFETIPLNSVKSGEGYKLEIKSEELHVGSVLNANRKLGGALLSKLLSWAVSLDDPSPLIEKLLELDPSSLPKLNAALRSLSR